MSCISIIMYSCTCHERTPSGPGKKCPCMTGGRKSGGRAGLPNVIPLHDYITSDVIVMFAIVIERKSKAPYGSWGILYSSRTTYSTSVNFWCFVRFTYLISGRPPELQSTRMAALSASIHVICVFPHQLAARQQAFYTYRVYTMHSIQPAEHLHFTDQN